MMPPLPADCLIPKAREAPPPDFSKFKPNPDFRKRFHLVLDRIQSVIGKYSGAGIKKEKLNAMIQRFSNTYNWINECKDVLIGIEEAGDNNVLLNALILLEKVVFKKEFHPDWLSLELGDALRRAARRITMEFDEKDLYFYQAEKLIEKNRNPQDLINALNAFANR
ncbi:hypothetical protein KJ780_01155 [Candidatus Micrarchaeota archaeon]|nr:hypothetical protein [Candidatus Micrarchaeota archaeon]